jgi:hypothetical protein
MLTLASCVGADVDELDHEHFLGCSCSELIIEGKRVAPPPRHDCNYVAEREKLVPYAVQLANMEVVIDCAAYGNHWTAAFARHVEALAAGICNGKACVDFEAVEAYVREQQEKIAQPQPQPDEIEATEALPVEQPEVVSTA